MAMQKEITHILERNKSTRNFFKIFIWLCYLRPFQILSQPQFPLHKRPLPSPIPPYFYGGAPPPTNPATPASLS